VKLFGSIKELVSAVFRKDNQEITLRPNQTATYSGATDIQLPNSSDTTQELVEIDASQTLTNKSISGDQIDSGTLPDARIQASGVTQHQGSINHNSISGGSTSSGVHGVSGTIVGTTGAQTLEEKTLDAATVGGSNNNGTDGFLLLKDQSSDPSAASGDDVKLFCRDSNVYKVDATGVATELGSGAGQGELNYVTNPSGVTDTSDWAESTDGAVDISRSTTAGELPRANLTGTGLKIVGTAAATDEYVRTRFTIDDADKNKLLKIQWDQRIVSGYTSGDFEVELYTNAASDYSGAYTQVTTADSSISAADGRFLTTFASTSADYYELRIKSSVASSNGIVISNVIVGPGSVVTGAAITTSYSPTTESVLIYDDTDDGNYTVESKISRNGDKADIDVAIAFSGAATTTGILRLYLPDDLTIDGSRTVDYHNLGEAVLFDGSSFYGAFARLNVASGTDRQYVLFYPNDGGGSAADGWYVNVGTPANSTPKGANFDSNDTIVVRLRGIPIKEWSGSGTVNIVSGSNSSPVIAKYSTNAGDTYPQGTTRICYEDMEIDTHDAVSFTNFATGDWVFTAPKSAYYYFYYKATTATTGLSSDIGRLIIEGFANSVAIGTTESAVSEGYYRKSISSSALVYMNAGETFYVTFAQNNDAGGVDLDGDGKRNFVIIHEVFDPSDPGALLGFLMASDSAAGLVSTAAQTFAGEKTFDDGLTSKKIIHDRGATLTISGGAVTATHSYHRVDTESGAASDDLDTINGGTDGQVLVLTSVAAARDVVAKDGTGNLSLSGDFTLGDTTDTLSLIYDSTASAWLELSRSNN